MATHKRRFHFQNTIEHHLLIGESRASCESLVIEIQELLPSLDKNLPDETVGESQPSKKRFYSGNLDALMFGYTWPCAAVLSQFIWHNRNQFTKKTVLEISAGSGLPAVLAAKLGSSVIVSECDLRSWNINPKSFEKSEDGINDAMNCIDINSRINNVELGRIYLNWGEINKNILNLPPLDFILASDILYNENDFDSVFFTISFLLNRQRERERECICYMTYQCRDEDLNILLKSLCQKWKINLRQIELKSFNGNIANIAESDLPGILAEDILLFEITAT